MVRQRFQPFKKAKQAKGFWDNAQEPQEGLVPLFNSPFYTTPDTPADPTDCNRYPDSPYCGGNPLTAKFAPSIEVSMVRDECNLGIQIDGSFAFIKVPPVQIVYRDPACRIPPPPPPPNDDYSEYADIPESQYESDLWLVIPQYRHYYYSHGLQNTFIDETVNFTFKGVEGIIGESPVKATLEVNYRVEQTSLYHWITWGNRPGEWEFEADINHWIQRGGTIAGDPAEEGTIWTLNINYEVYSYWQGYGTTYHDVPNNWRYEANGNWFPVPFKGAIYFIPARYSEFIVSSSRPKNFKRTSLHTNGSIFTIEESRVKIVPLHEKPPTPPPPPKRMCCCPNVEQNDQLLKLILKKIGATNLPASVPKVLTDRKKGTIKIESLAEFTAYTVKQLDALCGKYPIDIEIEDADLTQEGNQTKKLKLPNISETLAEMMGLLLVLRSESDATLNAVIRALTEAGSSKQMAFLAYEYAKANAEFLGYKGEQKERKIPFAFKPGEQRLDKMLQEGEISVRGWENEDKDDFNDLIAPILELAAMWKVQNYRKTGAGDPRQGIIKALKNAAKFSDDIDAGILLEKVKAYNAKDDKDKNPKDLDDDWDKFTEETEMGFISQPGIKDKEKPYGRPLEERPRVRDISSDTSE